MPESNTDPEKYSIDEMLQRLKSRGDGEGELVTRADGTQAIKVRKRKRRTDQSKDKLKAHNQRVQLIQIAGFIVFLMALLIVGGILILYSNSAAYRSGLISKIGSITGSKAKIVEFRMNPAKASAATLDLDWPKNHVLRHLDARTIDAKISPISFLGKLFQGQEVVAETGNLALAAPTGVAGPAKASSGTGSLIRFDRFSVSNMNIFFDPEMSWGAMIQNVEASYLPSKTSKTGELRLNHGLVKVVGWPELVMDRCYIKIQDDELDIKSLGLELPPSQNQKTKSKGSIQVSGVIKPLEAGATHKLYVTLDSFQISHLLGASFGKCFNGHAISNADETSNVFQFAPGSGKQPLLEMNVTNALDSRISVSQFKFLGHLAIALEDRWYELPSFSDEVKLLIKRSGDAVEIKDIHLEQNARMAIKGSLSQAGVNAPVTGKLRVGVPDIIIAASKNRRLEAIFSPEKDGYRWLELEVGGSGADLTDNFKQLYQSASLDAKTAQPSGVENKPKQDGVDSFDKLIEDRK